MSEKLQEEVGLFANHNVFTSTKTILLIGDVDEDMLKTAAVGLHSLDSRTGDITIKLISDGGCVSTARAIYDLIKGCKNFVRIQCYGEVASSATIILQAGDKRVMAPNSKLMVHVGEESVPSNNPRNADRLREQHRIDEKWMEDIYLKKIKEKKPRFTRQKLKSILEYDTYLNPKEALELGLVDEEGEISWKM